MLADGSQGCVIKCDRVDLIVLGAECGFTSNFDELDWSARPVENRLIIGVAEVRARFPASDGTKTIGSRFVRNGVPLIDRMAVAPDAKASCAEVPQAELQPRRGGLRRISQVCVGRGQVRVSKEHLGGREQRLVRDDRSKPFVTDRIDCTPISLTSQRKGRSHWGCH